ncbi:MAG: flagellar biosynthesis anti-sigma factor FlgM [Defluviitaleaceae bacterium]|nr:flagellar biosynthesis anti-sigma factor FlgM [Defluviitaleaceae bacterium]
MRINDIFPIPQPISANGRVSKNPSVKAPTKDEYAPSDSAKDYHTAMKALQNLQNSGAAERQDLIDNIKSRIAVGDYIIPADAVAARIVARLDG